MFVQVESENETATFVDSVTRYLVDNRLDGFDIGNSLQQELNTFMVLFAQIGNFRCGVLTRR